MGRDGLQEVGMLPPPDALLGVGFGLGVGRCCIGVMLGGPAPNGPCEKLLPGGSDGRFGIETPAGVP